MIVVVALCVLCAPECAVCVQQYTLSGFVEDACKHTKKSAKINRQIVFYIANLVLCVCALCFDNTFESVHIELYIPDSIY